MSEYRRLIRFVFPHIWVLAAAGICMTISSAFSGVSMGMIIPLVDNIIRGKKIACASGVYTPGSQIAEAESTQTVSVSGNVTAVLTLPAAFAQSRIFPIRAGGSPAWATFCHWVPTFPFRIP